MRKKPDMTLFNFGGARRNARKLQEAANKARDQANWRAAAEHYNAYLKAKPKDARIWVQLGHMLKEDGAIEEAEKAYLRSLSLAPEIADTHVMLGHLKKITNKLTQAAAHYADAVNIEPENLDARLQLAFVEKDIGNKAVALQHFQVAHKLDPDNQEVSELIQFLSPPVQKTSSPKVRKAKQPSKVATKVSEKATETAELQTTVKAMAFELQRLRKKAEASDKTIMRLETSLALLQKEVTAGQTDVESRLINIEAHSPAVGEYFKTLLNHIEAAQSEKPNLQAFEINKV